VRPATAVDVPVEIILRNLAGKASNKKVRCRTGNHGARG
jgi:hypothetical protein